MKILITGGSGLLGSKFALLTTDEYDIAIAYFTHEVGGEKSLQLDVKIRFKHITSSRKYLPML